MPFPSPAGPSSDAPQGLVWVLEDSPLEAEMARRALASTHTVEIFADAPAALEQLANGARPDALVLDCQLPTLTGIDVCRFIRESYDEMELPIVMLTVEGHRADLVDGLLAGANEYLVKPYHVAELLARVGTLVRTSHLHRARARRARELALTAEVGAMLTRGRESSAQLCAAAIARHLSAAVATIWTADERGGLALAAAAGPLASARVAPPMQAVAALTVTHVAGPAAAPLVDAAPWREALDRAFVAVPLVVETRVVGALAVAMPRRMEEDEIAALAPLADLVALGLDRLRAERERSALLVREQRARADAEAANRAKDEFLAIVSHELRTPLNAIAGWVHMLRNGAVQAANVDRALATIDRNARAQAQLIDDLLDVSRIVSGKLALAPTSVDLPEVIESTVESLRPMAEERGVALSALVGAVGPVVGDASRLKQVASNLLTNALKFTPRGGKVRVTLRRDEAWAILEVDDTGRGIDPAFLPHVFDRFRQAETSKARQHGGLGLGLAIVRRLVELHGGTVSAESAGIGRGARFTVALPLAQSGVDADAAASAPAAASIPAATTMYAGVDIVVVDDDEDGRELVAQLLRDGGAEVRTASCAVDALALVRAKPPHVMVSDIGMPGMDGFELMRRVRALAPAPGAPRLVSVALSAYARAEDRAAAASAGFDAHLSKPFDPGELLALIARLGRGG